MKKKKLLRNASLVALSAVMICGGAATLTACGSGDYTLVVSSFGNTQDSELTKKLCNDWAADYTEKLRAEGKIPEDQSIKIDYSSTTNTDNYFSTLANLVASGGAPDVFYVSPKYVKAWSTTKRIIDLTPYITANEESIQNVQDIWEDSLGFYGYSSAAGYTQGERVTYDAATKKFKTAGSGVDVGIYGLPKDYSNFGLGFNNVFFSDKMKTEYTTRKATDKRSVKGAKYDTAALNFKGGNNEKGVITYAVDYDGHQAGTDAPIINIGVPTTYKPYNFYQFASYQEAVNGGDLIANIVESQTNGEGYTVTIPGWPGEKFTLPEGTTKNPDAVYDENNGYVVYTYQEYSALTWALTYYLNTFGWDDKDPDDTLSGTGGRATATEQANIYGNDQYDGTLYFLPWLAGNDAAYINTASNSVINGSDATKISEVTEDVNKIGLDGKVQKVKTQYGVNSKKYIETYNAFLAYGSHWNGNSNFAGDTSQTKASGFDLFCAGNCIFYGAGTWDASTRNKTEWKYLQFNLMPEPISEDFALYSTYVDYDYNTTLAEKGTKQVYDKAARETELAKRQDQWGARMDSVGYGANADLLKLEGASSWKAEGAASLVQYLSINKDVQVQLTYAGSQLPNFKSQCKELLTRKEDAKKESNNNSFKDMVTPEDEKWAETYAIAEEMAKSQEDVSVKEWMAAKHATVNFDDAHYGSMSVKNDVTDRAFAMKVLYMTTYTYADCDLSLRMQSGLNAVRDSGMYTYNTDWLSMLEGRGQNILLAYEGRNVGGKSREEKDAIIAKLGKLLTSTSDLSKIPTNGFGTPAWFCLYRAQTSQNSLNDAIKKEKQALGI